MTFRHSVVFFGICSASIVSMSACNKQPPRPDRAPLSVAVAVAHRASVPYTIESNGIVMPMQTANVTAQVDGLVQSVLFEEGQDVEKGQTLFRIDPRPYQNAFDQARGTLARDKAAADNARTEFARYDAMHKGGVVTAEEIEARRATMDATAATLQGDSAALATARFNLDNTVIRAPITGRTGAVLVREGNQARAGVSTPLVVINQVRPILVRFAVPSTQLPLVLQHGARGGLPVTLGPSGAVGSPADSAPPALDAPRGGGARPVAVGARRARGAAGATRAGAGDDRTGLLTFIDNAVDTTTGTVQLKARFRNAAGQMWPGQFVATSLQLYVEDAALVVPAQCVLTGQRGAYVYVVDSANKADQRFVTVERTAGGVAVISTGLSDGDRVVADGQSRLTPGARVELRSAGDSAGGRRGGRNAPRSGQAGGASRAPGSGPAGGAKRPPGS